jgi:hypothetical protein
LNYDKTKHEKILKYESMLKDKINEIFEIIDEAARDGVMFEEIDNILQK